MLISLNIQNYALIEALKMAPSPNLNIITGETGAGKSIMLGAIGLLLGNRADSKALLDEEKKCVIEGVFDIGNYALAPVFQEEDLDYDTQSIIRREISTNGKSRAFINDTPVTLETLKKIGVYLMDVHSQHDSLQLTSNIFQLQVLDSYAQNENLLTAYKNNFSTFKKARNAHDELLSDAAESRKTEDYNSFLLEELLALQLQPDEQVKLEEELEILENSEEIKLKLNAAVAYLINGERSVTTQLYEALAALKGISKFSSEYEALAQRIESCYIELKDIGQEVEGEEEAVIFDPEKIQVTKERLSAIYQLQQKHQVNTVEDLLEIQEQLQLQLDKVLNLDEKINESKQFLDNAEKDLAESAQLLSDNRQSFFQDIETKIAALLKSVGMPDATFTITREETPPSATGIDEINFLFSANKGIKPQNLKNTASGGEFSRLMFCIKYILADKTALPTIVFDEIDTGVSGEIALKMVNMMNLMAKKHQVVVISHLPQIAAKGDTHYFVYKDNSASKTVSKIKKLSEEERVTEIAKMIGGDNPSPIAFESAKELMKA